MLKSINVLVIEDVFEDFDLIQEYLQFQININYKLHHSDTLHKAIDALKNNHFDIVLLDLGLPDSQGLTTFNTLTKIIKGIPIVVLTGLEDDLLAKRLIASGAQDYLVKGSFDTNLLIKTIHFAIERNILEESILAKESNLKKIIEKNSDALLVVNNKGIIKYANQTALVLFDENLHNFIGTNLGFPIEDKTEVDVLLNGKVHVNEMRCVKFLWENQPAFLLSLRDITERKKMEDLLRESEEKHRVLFELAPENIILVDRNNFILDCNISFLNMLGYEKEEVIGKPLKLFTYDKDIDKFIAAFDKLSFQNKTEVEIRYKKKNGELIPVWRTINALFDQCGEFDGAIIHSRDFTIRKNFENKLQKQHEHIQLINKILRHDITNNLAAIRAHLKLFRNDRDMRNIDGSEEYLAKSIQLIRRMKSLEEFLDSNAELNLFNLNKVIIHAAEKYEHQLEVALNGYCQVLADHAIDSIFDNLFGNAIKHGKANKIEVKIEDCKDKCVVKVCDNGVGIKEELREKIFDENFTSSNIRGTGLGLHIVKNTMERYGGCVFAEANIPQGSVFVLVFKKV